VSVQFILRERLDNEWAVLLVFFKCLHSYYNRQTKGTFQIRIDQT
jgi:hypothetical protein